MTGCGKPKSDLQLPPTPGNIKLLASGNGPTFKADSPSTDPGEILKRMVKAYQSPNALQVRMSTDSKSNLTNTNTSHQETVTTFKKSPGIPKMHRMLIDKMSGTHIYYLDGSNMYTYQALPNVYTRRPLTGGIDKLSQGLEEDAPLILGVATMLSAIDLPPGLSNLKYSGKQAVNGKDTYVIDADFTTAFLKDMAEREKMKSTIAPQSGHAKLWIDAETYFISKCIADVQLVAQRPNAPAVTIVETFTQTLKGLSLNPEIKDDFFDFKQPRKSIEVFIPRKIPSATLSDDPFAVKSDSSK